jgi:hypothetical protein
MKIIKGSKNMKYAGHYNLHEPVIRINPKIRNKKYVKLVTHHEKRERVLRIRHKMSYKKAHKLATKSERNYARRLKVNWRKYSIYIDNLYSRRKKK